MTLNLIDKKMVVKNTVTLLPEKSYTYASELCSDLNSLEIESAGTYGQLNAKSLQTKVTSINNVDFEKVYFVNNKFDFSGNNPLEKINSLKDLTNNQGFNSENFKAQLDNTGLTPDHSKNYSFGIEKVKQKYLIEDKNYFKKKSIKNLCRYYKENMKYRSLRPVWGFDNYNCLNFFSIKNDVSRSLTHQNCIVYPNERVDDSNAYKFYGSNNNLTLSFYINQNKKNKEGYHFNPGCILFIPGIIGLYVVKGSNVDKNGLTDSFRLYASFDDNFDHDFLQNNLSLAESASDNSNFLSSDNILEFNHWHNVTFLISHNQAENVLFLDLYVDGQTIDNSVEINVQNYNKISTNSFVCIGNNPVRQENSISEMFKLLFSVNKLEENDFLGPYANKHISFSSEFIEAGVSQQNFDLLNSISDIEEDYTTADSTSFALNAEIHDIRIYNKLIRDVNNVICKNNVTDFSNQELIFCVPVLYYDVDILKKSVVNLHTEVNDINTAHLMLTGPVNHVFSNKCLGHEVNIEKFTYEFKNKTSPNIILNNDVSSDQTTYNILKVIADESVINNSTQKIKTGNSVNEILREAILGESDLDDFYYQNSFAYKNNLVMPCDNGLQDQKRHGFLNYYQEEEKPGGHFVDNEYFDISHISLVNFIKDDVILESTRLKSESGDPGLYQFAYDLNSLKVLEDRENFWVDLDNDIKFKNNYDFFKNTSLNNFIRNNFSLDNDNDDYKVKTSARVNDSLEKTLIDIGQSNLFKDLSNHVCRKINDDYSNSIANYLAKINFKNLSLDGLNIISYYRTELPIYNTTDNKGENFSKSLCLSTQLMGKRLEKDSVTIYDSDLGGTFGSLKMTLKDNGRGGLYRADAKTKIADWNSVGHVLYNEGIINILHPSLENFAEVSYKVSYTGHTNLNVLELNLPAYGGRTNKTRNESNIKDLRMNESAFNSDEDFVYITDINLHDENLNIVAKAKIVQPYAKKDSDGVLFRLKMDF